MSSRSLPVLSAISIIMAAFGLWTSAWAAQPVGSWGAGIELGEPNGFSGAYIYSPTSTIDGVLAYSSAREGAWQIHSDYLFTRNRLFEEQPKELDPYIGGGLRFKFEHSLRLGVRVPVGATYDIPTIKPLQAFAELAPILDFAPELTASVNIGIGIRYFF